MADTIDKRYRREAAEFGMSEEYENAEADVAESTDETIDELKAKLRAKVSLLKLRRTIDSLRGVR
tara:strand:+ start:326 stop:520 length:195 start_codon:yes stop_codon:yes gene_type:complete